MKHLPFTTSDQELVQAARETLRRLYKKDWHGVSAAIRTKSGKIFTAIHLEATVGRIAVCGEAVALGKAISEGEEAFEAIVAMWYPNDDTSKEPRIALPCGMCREMLSDYQPDIAVIIQEGNEISKVPVSELLPHRADDAYNCKE